MTRPKLGDDLRPRYTRDRVLGVTTWHPAPLGAVPDLIVDPTACDGVRVWPTLQSAIDRALSMGAQGFDRPGLVIGVAPGRHGGLAVLPSQGAHEAPLPVKIVGLGDRPEDCVLVESIDAEMPGTEFAARFGGQFAQSPASVQAIAQRIAAKPKIGTFNASVLRIERDGTVMRNLTVVNSYAVDRDLGDGAAKTTLGQFVTGQHQAVAALVSGADQVMFDRVRMESFQDTLYLESRDLARPSRVWLKDCWITGDVDFIFGQAVAYFEGCELVSRGTRAAQAWVTAPSTNIRQTYGFVFDQCRFTHDGSPRALAGTMRLGRQWFEGVRATPFGLSPLPGYAVTVGAVSQFDDPTGTISLQTLESVGKCILVDCQIGGHIAAAPWGPWAAGDKDKDGWTLRFRPALYRAGAFLGEIGDWLAAQGLDYSDLDPEEPWLGEIGSRSV